MLENPAIEKIGQNLKYDMIVLRAAGVEVAGVQFDTMVASYLLDAGERNHNLDELAGRYLDHTTIKIEELIGSGKNQKRMDEVPRRRRSPHYAAEDADVALRLRPLLAARLKEAEAGPSCSTTSKCRWSKCWSSWNSTASRSTPTRLAELSRQYGAADGDAGAGDLRAGRPRVQHRLAQATAGDAVRRAEAAGARRGPRPAPAPTPKCWRSWPGCIRCRPRSSSIGSTPSSRAPTSTRCRRWCIRKPGRVHASFNQVVAATGRLSSSDPNLQNIPVRTEEGREIRSAFLPGEPGWMLLAADYSQIELRVLAHFSGDETLCGGLCAR